MSIQGFPRCSRVFQGAPGFPRDVQDFPWWFPKVSQNDLIFGLFISVILYQASRSFDMPASICLFSLNQPQKILLDRSQRKIYPSPTPPPPKRFLLTPLKNKNLFQTAIFFFFFFFNNWTTPQKNVGPSTPQNKCWTALK